MDRLLPTGGPPWSNFVALGRIEVKKTRSLVCLKASFAARPGGYGRCIRDSSDYSNEGRSFRDEVWDVSLSSIRMVTVSIQSGAFSPAFFWKKKASAVIPSGIAPQDKRAGLFRKRKEILGDFENKKREQIPFGVAAFRGKIDLVEIGELQPICHRLSHHSVIRAFHGTILLPHRRVWGRPGLWLPVLRLDRCAAAVTFELLAVVFNAMLVACHFPSADSSA